MLTKFIDGGRPRRRKWLICAASLLGGCAAPAAPLADTQAPNIAAVQAITAIRLERGCFGCAGSVLVLRRDGTASWTVTGNARQATVDKTSKATLPAGEFDRLAQFILSHGFFALNESYEDPDIKDGPWTATTVARAAKETRVFRRDEAGPDALKEVEAAVEALRTHMTFAP